MAKSKKNERTIVYNIQFTKICDINDELTSEEELITWLKDHMTWDDILVTSKKEFIGPKK